VLVSKMYWRMAGMPYVGLCVLSMSSQ
jgi:hypothetical protein